MEKILTIEEFDEKYVPINNHFANDEAIFHFETCGEELEFVLEQDNNKIWTIVDGDTTDNLYIVSGYHLVNRVGYVVTEKEWDTDMCILYHESEIDLNESEFN